MERAFRARTTVKAMPYGAACIYFIFITPADIVTLCAHTHTLAHLQDWVTRETTVLIAAKWFEKVLL